jgi:glycosyltransferase involved in cell wall biosynthesis
LAPQIPVEVIFNGHEGILPLPPGPANDPVVRIVHAGTIYKQYNVQPLLEAVRGLIDCQQIETSRLELHFLGDKLGNLPAELDRYRLRDIARLPGQVPRSAAHAAQSQAPLLLLLGTNEPGILHGKLFEYIAACRPVLDVGDTDATDAAQVLRATRCGIAVGNDVQMIQQVILQVAEGHQPDWFSPDLEKIATYSRDHQSRKLETLFQQLLEI